LFETNKKGERYYPAIFICVFGYQFYVIPRKAHARKAVICARVVKSSRQYFNELVEQTVVFP
jgi:hypothetical protein